MNFTPYPGKIEIEPITPDTVLLLQEAYEEMGRVIQVGEGVTWIEPGDVVFFLAYGVEQTPDYQGKIHYVVPATDKFIIGKCKTPEANVKTDTSTITVSIESTNTESRRFAVDAKTDSSSITASPVEFISDTTSEKS